jgi:hypothetical protein
VTKLNSIDILNSNIYVDDMNVGKVRGVIIDPEEWKLTHLEVELTKKAAKELLGADNAVRNKLAISALRKGKACCTEKGIVVKVSKKQLPIYLRPVEA